MANSRTILEQLRTQKETYRLFPGVSKKRFFSHISAKNVYYKNRTLLTVAFTIIKWNSPLKVGTDGNSGRVLKIQGGNEEKDVTS